MVFRAQGPHLRWAPALGQGLPLLPLGSPGPLALHAPPLAQHPGSLLRNSQTTPPVPCKTSASKTS
eukprot:7875593-Lingulodinium_polyedra.AAC.1